MIPIESAIDPRQPTASPPLGKNAWVRDEILGREEQSLMRLDSHVTLVDSLLADLFDHPFNQLECDV